MQSTYKIEQEIHELKEMLNTVLSTLAEKEIHIKEFEEKVLVL